MRPIFFVLGLSLHLFASCVQAEGDPGRSDKAAVPQACNQWQMPGKAPAHCLNLRNGGDYKLKGTERYRGSYPGAAHAFDTAMPWGKAILREARANNLDPNLIAAVIAAESGQDPAALSPRGAIGLMQVMPDTGRRYGIENLDRPENNIRAGARYLRDLYALFDGDLQLVLAAYNAGENVVIQYGMRIPPFAETRDYVPRVLRKYEELRGTSRRHRDYRGGDKST